MLLLKQDITIDSENGIIEDYSFTSVTASVMNKEDAIALGTITGIWLHKPAVYPARATVEKLKSTHLTPFQQTIVTNACSKDCWESTIKALNEIIGAWDRNPLLQDDDCKIVVRVIEPITSKAVTDIEQ